MLGAYSISFMISFESIQNPATLWNLTVDVVLSLPGSWLFTMSCKGLDGTVRSRIWHIHATLANHSFFTHIYLWKRLHAPRRTFEFCIRSLLWADDFPDEQTPTTFRGSRNTQCQISSLVLWIFNLLPRESSSIHEFNCMGTRVFLAIFHRRETAVQSTTCHHRNYASSETTRINEYYGNWWCVFPYLKDENVRVVIVVMFVALAVIEYSIRTWDWLHRMIPPSWIVVPETLNSTDSCPTILFFRTSGRIIHHYHNEYLMRVTGAICIGFMASRMLVVLALTHTTRWSAPNRAVSIRSIPLLLLLYSWWFVPRIRVPILQ